MMEPIVRVQDVLYPRLRAPDLERMERFLVDFGLVRVARTERALYMRGAGPVHHVHLTELGHGAGLVGLAFLAAEARDLERLARVPGASAVHDTGEPGGGRRVTLTDPNGFTVEVVHGMAAHPDPIPGSLPLNLGNRVERERALKRPARSPARIKRFGHAGLNTPRVEETFAWYRRHLGLVTSDAVAFRGTELARFCRCDRGADTTDHHTLLVAQGLSDRPSLNHAAWEVCDLDDVWLGHEVLARGGHRHHWGVGRHTLGSQIFDYWRDPWGLVHEHFTDGDLIDGSHEAGVHGPEDAGSQWGPQMPPDFGQPLEEPRAKGGS
jgi:catechol 2,3-dioxygenase-like lactoylglutathione lyase family enzyme